MKLYHSTLVGSLVMDEILHLSVNADSVHAACPPAPRILILAMPHAGSENLFKLTLFKY